MRKDIYSLFLPVAVIFLLLSAVACDKDDLWDELPRPVAKFVSSYFAESGVNAYSVTSDAYRVRLNGGMVLVFAENYDWVDVNGNGGVLPQIFLFDQLPPSLYDYLQTGSLLGDVKRVVRTSELYTVTLTDTYVYYDIGSGKVTQGQYPPVVD